MQRNTPKLAGYAQSLTSPALTVGKGAVFLVVELFTIFVLVLLLLLEGPKMWTWTLGQMTQGRSAAVTRIAADVSGKVTGYMFGNLLTSLIAGTVVFVTLLILGVPFPLLWGLWVTRSDVGRLANRSGGPRSTASPSTPRRGPVPVHLFPAAARSTPAWSARAVAGGVEDDDPELAAVQRRASPRSSGRSSAWELFDTSTTTG